MKVLEAYTPANIRACGDMILRLQEMGESIDRFLDLAKLLRAKTGIKNISDFRLYLPTKMDKFTNEDFLMAIGYSNLKILKKIKKEINKRGIDDNLIANITKRLRAIELSDTGWGYVRAG